ncbi:type II and III secretion system protein family protein [Robbsia betulipollinis]
MAGLLALLTGAALAAPGVVPVADPLPASLPALPPLPASGGPADRIGSGRRDVLRLVAREQRLVAAPHVQRVAIGDPDVADIVPVGDGVLVVAKRPGTTQLSIWSARAGMPVVQTVDVRAPLLQAVPAGGAQIDVHDDTAVLSGTLASVPEQQLALAAARQSAAKVVDQSQIASSGTVQVDVKIVEFSKSVLKEAGFNLFSSRANGFGFGVFGANSATSYSPSSSGLAFGTTVNTALSSAFNLVAGPFGNGLFANLSMLETNGLARVLAQPTLVALSGQSASFLAGGELPVPVAAGLGTTTVMFKPFGIGLTVTPTVLSRERIALKVAPEASELDYTHSLTVSGTTIPAITTRRADTAVELGDGESFVIGGLVSRSTIASVDKVPLLGDLPIIGAFFKTLDYQRNDRELVIIVTPHLVRPIARGVAIPVPAEGRDSSDQPVWGAFLGGAAASGMELPGFSR